MPAPRPRSLFSEEHGEDAVNHGVIPLGNLSPTRPADDTRNQPNENNEDVVNRPDRHNIDLHGRPGQHQHEQRSQSLPRDAQPVLILDPAARTLTAWDVAALIVNKMIGTGIFTAPPAVLALTGNKGETIVLWFLGFLYTLLSMTIYLEFDFKLPFTGGELIFLDEMFPRPHLFCYTLYSVLFVTFFNTATSSMQFALQVLIGASSSLRRRPGDVSDKFSDRSAENLDQRLARFIAIAALTCVCLLLYWSTKASRAVNQFLAAIKVLMLVVLFVVGAVKAAMHNPFDFADTRGEITASHVSAFLLILFSFQGWENATFVVGEVQSYRTLRLGFMGAVWTVGSLYFLVNIVFLASIPYNDQNLDYASMFFDDSDAAQQGWAILTAISSSGSLVSVIYTSAKVKQAIGAAHILPWSNLTPMGGLILHWVVSTFWIIVTAAVYSFGEAVTFPAQLQTYMRGLIGMAFGFPRLEQQTQGRVLPQRLEFWTVHGEESSFLRKRPVRYSLATIYMIFNIMIVILPMVPPYKTASGATREVKGWYLVVINVAVLTLGLSYYALTFTSPRKTILEFAGVTFERDELAEHSARDKFYSKTSLFFVWRVQARATSKEVIQTMDRPDVAQALLVP
ncbi:MAG: hypothetical protein M1837_000659 [Sclerophora amabilis]|nr:MAG: hypothetical protein M1837_000659 [Sclerophora amabilis]